MLFTKIWVNVGMESVALCCLLILFFSCILQRVQSRSHKSFLGLCGNLMVMLMVEIALWTMDGISVGNTSNAMLPLLYRILFVLDFVSYYTLALFFNRYLENLLEGMGALSKRRKKVFHRVRISIAVWGLLSSGLFISSMWTGWFYTITDQCESYYSPNYIIFFFISLLVPISYLILTLQDRKALGLRKAIILNVYFFAPLFFIFFDLFLDLSISYLLFTFVTIIIYSEIQIRSNRENAEQKVILAHKESEMANLRVQIMLSQIQPHFLYNALSSISYLCTENPKEAEAATNEFASYLRSNLRSINTQRPILFSTELQHVANYLKIQKRRFQERLEVIYDIQTESFRIPALALQTIVENAVRHCVEVRFEPTTITIASRELDHAYEVSITDDGPGFDPEKAEADDHLHLGIENTRIRLKEIVGGSLQIESCVGKGTCVIIIIPKEEVAK